MVNINLILYIVLFLKINLSISKIEFDFFDADDFEKCSDQNRNKNDTDVCYSINSSLKLKEDQCCSITIIYDTLQQLKNRYPDNWKKMAAQIYRFDENLSEEEIREKYVKNQKQNICTLFTGDEDYTNYILYETSLYSVGGKITYDCGDGENSYKTKDFIPKQYKFKLVKDTAECTRQTNEADCHKAASKFLTEDVLACWNTVNQYDSNYAQDEKECRGYLVSEYKNESINILLI